MKSQNRLFKTPKMKTTYFIISFFCILNINTFGQCEDNQSLSSKNTTNKSWTLLMLENYDKSISYDVIFIGIATHSELSNVERNLEKIGYKKSSSNVYYKLCKSEDSKIYQVTIENTGDKWSNNVYFLTNDRKKYLSIKEDLMLDEDLVFKVIPKIEWDNFLDSKQKEETLELIYVHRPKRKCSNDLEHILRIKKEDNKIYYIVNSSGCIK